MGKFEQGWAIPDFETRPAREATNGVFFRGYVEIKGVKLAPRVQPSYEHANGENLKRYFLPGVNHVGRFRIGVRRSG